MFTLRNEKNYGERGAERLGSRGQEIKTILANMVKPQVLSSQQTNAGHIYSVMTYIWNFVISLDDSPKLIEEFSNLKDIGKRIDAEKKDNDA